MWKWALGGAAVVGFILWQRKMMTPAAPVLYTSGPITGGLLEWNIGSVDKSAYPGMLV
jgi:hypothetical protein